jgi:hypothetical protein
MIYFPHSWKEINSQLMGETPPLCTEYRETGDYFMYLDKTADTL